MYPHSQIRSNCFETPDWLAEGLGLLQNAFSEAISVVSLRVTGAKSLTGVLIHEWKTTATSRADGVAGDTLGHWSRTELEQLNQHLTTVKTRLGSTSDGLRKVARRATDELLPLLAKGIRILDCGSLGSLKSYHY